MQVKIYLIDTGESDGFPGLVKEIIRDTSDQLWPPDLRGFDLIEFTSKYDRHGYYVYDGHVKDDIAYRQVIRIARISEKKDQT
jgi:hypothetical protein